jgi:hypothetical protein
MKLAAVGVTWHHHRGLCLADAYTVLSDADQYALQFRVMRGAGAKH